MKDPNNGSVPVWFWMIAAAGMLFVVAKTSGFSQVFTGLRLHF
jgi:hypothetical protein